MVSCILMLMVTMFWDSYLRETRGNKMEVLSFRHVEHTSSEHWVRCDSDAVRLGKIRWCNISMDMCIPLPGPAILSQGYLIFNLILYLSAPPLPPTTPTRQTHPTLRMKAEYTCAYKCAFVPLIYHIGLHKLVCIRRYNLRGISHSSALTGEIHNNVFTDVIHNALCASIKKLFVYLYNTDVVPSSTAPCAHSR